MTSLRCLILAGAIALVASINGTGQNLRARLADTDRRLESVPTGYNAEPVPEPLSLPASWKLSDLEKAYLDTHSILKQDNSCSEFGGPQAIEVLNQLTKQIQTSYLERHVGLRMTGETTNILNFRTGFKYRLFDKAEVNLNGPFYQASGLMNRHNAARIGTFLPSSREARVTLLLHELGHLIRKPDGHWVLRDDGNDTRLSEENTRRVIEACVKQIREIHRFSFEAELSQAQYEVRNQAAVVEVLAG